MTANTFITAVNAGVGYTISVAANATNASASLTIGTNTIGYAGTAGGTSVFGTILQGAGGTTGLAGANAAATGGNGPLGAPGTAGGWWQFQRHGRSGRGCGRLGSSDLPVPRQAAASQPVP